MKQIYLLAMLLFGLLLCFVGSANMAASVFTPIRFSADQAMKGSKYWGDRTSAYASTDQPEIPAVLPGPADTWAGGGSNEINITGLVSLRPWSLHLELLDSHDNLPPAIEIIVDERLVTTLQITQGGGRPDHSWERLGIRSDYLVQIPWGYFDAPEPTLTIRNVKGSWIGIEAITLTPGVAQNGFIISFGAGIGKVLFWSGWLLIMAAVGGLVWRRRATFCSKEALFTLALFVLMPTLFFGGIELTLIVFDIANPDRAEDPYVGFENYIPFVIAAPDDPDALMINPRRSPLKQRFAKHKPKNGIRVMLFGGSNTFNFQPELKILAKKIRAVFPDRVVEVINFGAAGYGSHRVVPVVQEALDYAPDVILLYTGHNEFLEKTFADKILGEPEWLIGLKGWLGQLRLYLLMRQLFRDTKERTVGFQTEQDRETADAARVILPDEILLDQRRYTDPTYAGVVMRRYEANLAKMIRMAGAHKIHVVIGNIASADLTPPRSPCYEHRLKHEEKKRLAELMRSVAATYAPALDQCAPTEDDRVDRAAVAAMVTEAAAPLKEAAKISPNNADLLYWNGFTALCQGRFDEARQLLSESTRYDCAPFRGSVVTNEIIGRLAERYGARLVDLETEFRARYAPAKITFHRPKISKYDETAPDGVYFYDHCHLNRAGRKIALALFADALIETIRASSTRF